MVYAAELLYLSIASRLLMCKLVTRETYYNQSLILILLIQSLQTIVLRGESAFSYSFLFISFAIQKYDK